jgi:hypothetical protein
MMSMVPLYGYVAFMTVALELLRYCKMIAKKKNICQSLNGTVV